MAPPKNNQAFTLLEVLLSLVLAAMLMTALGMAIHTHLRIVDSGRSGVEDTRLAHSVLQHMSNDICATLRHEKFDDSGLAGLLSKSTITKALASQSASTSGQSKSGTSGESDTSSSGTSSKKGSSTKTAGQSGTSSTAGTLSTTATDAEQDPTQTAPQMTPGLYGYQNQLQIDISRFPRLDEYGGTAAAEGKLFLPPSDVRTVVYYLQARDATTRGGLMRREIPRAASLYAYENGTTDEFNAAAQLIAPEVTGLTFEYFDGQGWSSEWDSSAVDMLPVAVKIHLTMETTTGPKSEPIQREYSLVVQLASGQPVIVETPPSTEATDGSTQADSTIAGMLNSGSNTSGAGASSGTSSKTGTSTGSTSSSKTSSGSKTGSGMN